MIVYGETKVGTGTDDVGCFESLVAIARVWFVLAEAGGVGRIGFARLETEDAHVLAGCAGVTLTDCNGSGLTDTCFDRCYAAQKVRRVVYARVKRQCNKYRSRCDSGLNGPLTDCD